MVVVNRGDSELPDYLGIAAKKVWLIIAAMPFFEMIALAVVAGLVWLWLDSVRAREAALRATANACAEEGLQLLDETVAVRSLRLARDASGRLRLRREYGFEYSETGENRQTGMLALIGDEIEMLHLRPRLYVIPRSE